MRPGAVLILACGMLLLMLGGCAVREQRPEGAWLEEREAWFALYPSWQVSGRLALSDGEQGGQLSFDWRAEGDQHDLRLRTAAGGRQWRLLFNPHGAVLEGSDVGLVRGPDPDALVAEVVGWPIPVLRLAYWLRGLHSGLEEQVGYAEDGTMARIAGEEWVLDYLRFTQMPDGPLMPQRVHAESPPYQVRMLLRGWRWMDPGA